MGKGKLSPNFITRQVIACPSQMLSIIFSDKIDMHQVSLTDIYSSRNAVLFEHDFPTELKRVNNSEQNKEQNDISLLLTCSVN